MNYFKWLILFLFVAFCGTIIYFKVASMGSPDSRFNQGTRFTLGKYQIMRSLLSLHNDGDARGWYLEGTGPITIEVVQAEGARMDDDTINNFVKNVEQYTGRVVNLFNTETIPAGTLSDADLGNVATQYRHKGGLNQQPSLFVIYAEDFTRSGAELGKTLQEFGIVISDRQIRETAGNLSQSVSQYTESTLLHEFGHQVGLPHNDQSGCIMNASVDQPGLAGQFTGSFTQTVFCPFELDQLNAIRASLH